MSRNYFSIFVLKWDVVRLIKNPFINIKRQLMVTNFTLVLYKIAEKDYIRCNIYTNFPANIRLGEDVLKTSSRRLQDVFSVTFFCLPRRLEDALKTSWRHNCNTSCKHVLKTSWRRLEDILGRRTANTLEDEKCYAEDVFKTSWRRLGKQEMFAGLTLTYLFTNSTNLR